MASTAGFAIQHCYGRAAAVSSTVLVGVIVTANGIVEVTMAKPVHLARVCALRRRGGRLLNNVSISCLRYAVASENT
jgi:hypothetical protein